MLAAVVLAGAATVALADHPGALLEQALVHRHGLHGLHGLHGNLLLSRDWPHGRTCTSTLEDSAPPGNRNTAYPCKEH